MKRLFERVACKGVIVTLLMLTTSAVTAQNKFFSPDDYVNSGIYYYPEHWPESEWEHDIKKIAELGFEFVHMAEFSWAMLEPTEGQFNFDWLDKAISICEQNNLKVLLGTPTPTPPVWLTQKYPETMLVRSNGIRCEHGSRACYSWSSDKYHELTKIIVKKMAERYGHNPNVIGWQVDNEPSHYSQVDYSPIIIPKFQQWLKEKYKTIDVLNKEWGTAMWSGTFNNFDQIRLPNPETHPNGISSPTWQLDFRRFSANEFSIYMNMQAEVLRKHISANQWITTNCTALFTETDNFRLEGYDFLSYTEYFVRGHNSGLGEQGFRLGDYRETSLKSEYTKSYGGISGVMEIQPGQINWAEYNVQLHPGVLRASLWQCFGLGESFVCSYRFKQPRYGGEQYHYGMIAPDGNTLQPGGKEYMQFNAEIKNLRKDHKPGKNPEDYEARRTAYLLKYDNLWSLQNQPQTKLWNKEGDYTIYNQLKNLVVPVTFIEETDDFSQYKVMIAANYEMVSPQLIEKWENYVKNGGHLILSCRTGHKKTNGHFWKDKWAGPIYKLIGGEIEYYDVLPADYKAEVSLFGETYNWNIWGDIMEANNGTEQWATYTNQFYKNKAAVLHRKLGNGTVTYIGILTANGAFEKEVLKEVYKRANLTTQDIPHGMFVSYRDGFGVAVNFHTNEQTAPIPEKAQIVMGQARLKTTDVVIWK